MNLADMDDSVLRRAARGDHDAFEQLILSIERLIYNIALRMMGNSAEAEDVAQESILKIYKNIKKCSSLSHFKNWACVITNNTCIDELRKKRNSRGAVSLDALADPDNDLLPVNIPSDDPTPPDILIRMESRDAVLGALEMLPPTMKSAIILRDIEGISYADLAVILEVAEGTVKSRLNRARAALRKIIISKEQKEV